MGTGGSWDMTYEWYDAAFHPLTRRAAFSFYAFFDGSFVCIGFARSSSASSPKEAEVKSIHFALRNLIGKISKFFLDIFGCSEGH